MHKGKMQWNFTDEAQNNKYGTKTFFALLLLCLFFSCCSRQGIKFRADSALGVFTGPADDEGEQPSSQSLTPLDASTSSVSSSLCSMCLSKGFPSRRNNWKRESSSWAGPLDDAACLLGETDGERHWPINLNSWIDGGRDGKNENCAEITENKWTTPTEGAKDTTARKTAYYIIFLFILPKWTTFNKVETLFFVKKCSIVIPHLCTWWRGSCGLCLCAVVKRAPTREENNNNEYGREKWKWICSIYLSDTSLFLLVISAPRWFGLNVLYELNDLFFRPVDEHPRYFGCGHTRSTMNWFTFSI